MSRFIPMPFTATAAVFAAVFAAGAVSSAAHAQETPLPVPPAPATPAAPVLPPAPAAPPANSEEAKADARVAAEAYRKAMEQYGKTLAETLKALQNNRMTVRGFGYPAAATLFGTARLPSKTINVDLKNVSARDALVKVLDEAKRDYVIDEDFPKDAKLSLSISGVQVSTALDLITQSAGVHWTAEKRDNKTIVRVGKSVKSGNFYYRSGGSSNFGLNGLEFNTSEGSPELFITPSAPAVLSSPAPPAGARPLLYQYRTTEQRSTFTCPKCGKKSTIVQKNNTKAGDTAAAHDNWHYCPFCGKKVSATQNAAPLWDDDNTENDAPETTAFWLPSLPTQGGIISEPDVFIAPNETK